MDSACGVVEKAAEGTFCPSFVIAELEEDLGMIRIDRCARHTKAECIEL